MPVSRGYGGGGYSHYHPPASVYATSYSSYSRAAGAGSTYLSGASSGRASSPGVNGEDSAPMYGTTSYRLLYGDIDKPTLRTTIKTEDLDVDRPDRVARSHAIPGTIRRDTAADMGDRGKQVVRMVTNRSKAAVNADGQELRASIPVDFGDRIVG